MPNTKTCRACASTAAERGDGGDEPPVWARRYIVIGIAIVALLSLSALAYRLLSADAPEVEVARAAAQNSDVGGTSCSPPPATSWPTTRST